MTPAQIAEMPEYPAIIEDELQTNGKVFKWPLVEKLDYDSLRAYAAALRERAEQAEAELKSAIVRFYTICDAWDNGRYLPEYFAAARKDVERWERLIAREQG